MRNTRYRFLVLLSSLLMLTGCSRRDILDDYPVSGVDIKLDWDGVTDQLPEGVRVIFYPKNGDGRKVGARRRNESSSGTVFSSNYGL